MKKIVSFLVLTFLSLMVLGQKKFVVDANASLRQLEGSFTKIKISGPVKVYLSQANEESLAVSASEEKYKESIKSNVKDNELHIFISGGKDLWRNSKSLKVYVSFKELRNLEISGAAAVMSVDAIKANQLSVDISGACNLAANLEVQKLDFEISGASKALISGSVDELLLDCSGASDFSSFELMAKNSQIDVSGASDVALTVVDSIKANASGASRIYYKGSPEDKELKESGASKIVLQNR